MRHTLAPRKQLGQHFLADDNIARKIAAAIAPHADDVMVEIGAGEGALTRQLAAHVKRFIAIELDDRAADVLTTTFGDTITLVRGDALNVSLADIAATAGAHLRVVGNIPYNITSPLLFHLFEDAAVVRDATLMIQREVADRLVAQPRSKEYGILSVMTQFHAVPRKLFTVAPGSFFPPPAVVSAVISLTFRQPQRDDVDLELFRRIVRGTFAKRRKILSNGLRDVVHSDEALASIGAQCDLMRRPEELSVEQFVALTNAAAAAGVHVA